MRSSDIVKAIMCDNDDFKRSVIISITRLNGDIEMYNITDAIRMEGKNTPTVLCGSYKGMDVIRV